ncbi:hypothetical protein [Winogradskyella sp. 3972H.M.0a.05]|uniref:hypothetical protein n=1 Tax=Winogradskyella sp. 3972H.M.0a.05 TaxID=2950277 RepID=UPI003394C2CB
MKRIVLLFTGLLMGLTTVSAAETTATKGTDLDITKRYRYTQPILFVERGVEFLIFPDGSFDFNTDFNPNAQGSVYYRRSRRGNINRTHGAPGTVYHNYGRPRGVVVTHDSYGRVRRIGNVFINYDRQGRIKRAGSVYMRYRRGLLKQVGGLHIQYNRRGQIIGTTGFVNFNNQGSGICGDTDYYLDNGFDNDWYDNDWNDDWDDDDFYYYRRDGKVKKLKKHKRSKRYDD